MKLYNTFSKKVEDFKPITKGETSIYVCGITPYDTTHLGHAFTYISFDALIRYLEYKNNKVNYTQNVTDINDRDNDILKRAKEQNTSWQELSDFWTKQFLKDMDRLNWRTPDNYLYASEKIEEMVKIIKKLIGNRIAYEVNESVYFNVSKDKDYGKLSGLNKEEMTKIAKVYDEDIDNPDKIDPLDITLWRSSSNQAKHIPSFNSPWGKGRPGWHIECSEMAVSSLGEQIDIHGGGKDLIFPHHEAEIAQSENATGKKPFARIWMHTGIISYEGQKMSKSLGNLVLISDLFKKYSANAIRLYLLSHKYNLDWEFTFSGLDACKIKFLDIEKAINKKLNLNKSSKTFLKEFNEYMENDLDTPGALDLIYRISKEINSGKETSSKTQNELKEMLSILGFKI